MARDSALEHLHPVFREKAQSITRMLNEEQIPFRLFEGFRSPERQRELFAQGRTKPGGIVTKADAWSSYHQYGVAADFVLFIDGKWSWDSAGERGKWWKKLHEVAKRVGLEPLSWELPHLQLQGLELANLRAGRYPDGGDEDWSENLQAAIRGWSGSPSAPPRGVVSSRPPLAASELVAPADVGGVATASALQRYRVIARRGLRLRGGPGTEFDVVENLATDQIVSVLASSGDWLQVDIEGDGRADGFCHSGFLEPVAA